MKNLVSGVVATAGLFAAWRVFERRRYAAALEESESVQSLVALKAVDPDELLSEYVPFLGFQTATSAFKATQKDLPQVAGEAWSTVPGAVTSVVALMQTLGKKS